MRKTYYYFNSYLKIGVAALLICGETIPQVSACIHNNFGTIEVTPVVELNGFGKNIDTIEFWKAPDVTNSLMFVSSKDTSVVEVWKYPFGTGDEQTPISHTTLEPDNAEVNGLQVDQETDLLYVSVGSPNSHVVVFTLPALTYVTHFNSNGDSYHREPNLTLLNLSTGDKHLYVSADNIVYIHDVSNAASQNYGDLLGSFVPIQGLETMQADDFYQNLIIPDESNTTGVYAYYPNGTDYPSTGQNNFGAFTIQGDGEGILLYDCSTNPTDQGEGFYVVADQLSPNSEFEFYDRENWEHYGTMKITGVSNTDGVASFPYSIPNYSMGVFAAINNDATTVLVSWETIFDEIDNNGGLPVELTSFSAFVKNNTVTLNWETATEVNNYGFEVEKAPLNPPKGGKEGGWEKIGFVSGHGNSNSLNNYSFTDDNVFYGKYKYRLKQIDNDGTFEYSNEIEIFVGNIPSGFNLEQNYPNPFNPSTTIRYSVPSIGTYRNTPVRLKVFDVLGNEVATLVNEDKPTGNYEVEFSSGLIHQTKGGPPPSGVYFYQLQVSSFVETKKMVLMK
jgi:hypothetical protein